MLYKTSHHSKSLVLILFAFFFLLILLIDYIVPFGISVGLLYVFPTALSCFIFKSPKLTYQLAFVSTVFILFGYLISDSQTFNYFELANRILYILTIWFVGFIGNMLLKSIEKAEKLDQMAKTALEAFPNAMVMIEESGKIILINKQTEYIFGYKKEELIGKSIELLVPQEIAEEHPKLRMNFFRNPEPRKMGVGRDLFGKRKDNTLVPVEIGLTPIDTSEGPCVVSSIVDITERKEAERNHEKQQEKLINVNKQLDNFAYVISHDLKAPLRGIGQIADWLYEDYIEKLDEEGKENLQDLKRRVKRLNNLIDGVLQYSRVDRSTVKKEMVNLKELAEGVVELLLPPSHISISIDPSLPSIWCVKIQLEQVFQNLLSNAIRYMDKKLGRIKINCHIFEDRVQILVEDNGPGIAKEHYDRIFELFQTLTSKDKIESTGIGLTITKKIIKLHGGDIWVESKVGEGTSFYFTLIK